MSLSGDVHLAGKLFNVVNYDSISVRNEHYIMKLMRSTGLDRQMPLVDGETDEQYQLRVHAAAVDTLQLPELLAGYLLPLGKTEADWTPEMARQTAEFMGGLSNQDDKAEIHRLGLLVTFDFFRAGLDLLRHSRNVLESLASSPTASASPEATH